MTVISLKFRSYPLPPVSNEYMSGSYTLLSGLILHLPICSIVSFPRPWPALSPKFSLFLCSSYCRHRQPCRSAAEELVRSQFGAFKNLPPQGNSSEQRRQAMGGSAVALNKLNDSAPLSSRNSSSIPDLVNTGATAATANDANNKQQLSDDLKAINPNTEPATIRSKFTPGNIFKNFFK